MIKRVCRGRRIATGARKNEVAMSGNLLQERGCHRRERASATGAGARHGYHRRGTVAGES